MSIDATDGTGIPFDASAIGTPFEVSERAVWNKYKNRNNTPEKLALLLNIYERTSGRGDTEIPTAAGLCIPNGFVAGPGREGQDTDAVYHLDGAPDVWFGFSSYDTITERDTLLQRAPELEKNMRESGAHLLRKGKRTIHGLPTLTGTRNVAGDRWGKAHITISCCGWKMS